MLMGETGLGVVAYVLVCHLDVYVMVKGVYMSRHRIARVDFWRQLSCSTPPWPFHSWSALLAVFTHISYAINGTERAKEKKGEDRRPPCCRRP